MTCTLCAGASTTFFVDPSNNYKYYHCPLCDLRFLDPVHYLNNEQELIRYKLHENDVNDVNYQNFNRPMFDKVISECSSGAEGLDFGCGPGPVLGKMLEGQGFHLSYYDPYFKPDTEALDRQYDFAIAIEAAEHFYNPAKEFSTLAYVLKPQAAGLGVMTSLYTDKIDFANWYYRRDPTHVCFYSLKTFEYIRDKFNFKNLHCDGQRTAWLSR